MHLLFRLQRTAHVVLLVTAATSLCAKSQICAAEPAWGHLKGQFVYDGDPPAREMLTITKDIEVCSKTPPLSEALLVNAQTHGLANVILWLDPSANTTVPVHPSYVASATKKVLLDNSGCRFEPHVCVMRPTQTLVIGNRDEVDHSAAVLLTKNDSFNVVVSKQGQQERHFKFSEKLPAPVVCPIHAWMKGYLIVKDHPYVVVTNANGEFELQNLPEGEWTFRLWHELPAYITEGERNGALEKWTGGKMTVKIAAGKTNELGTIRLKPALFAGKK